MEGKAPTSANVSASAAISNVFAKQITKAEYDNQKEDYTQKALRELQEQMKTFKRPLISKINTNNTNTNTINTNNKVNIIDDNLESVYDKKSNSDNNSDNDSESESESESHSNKDYNEECDSDYNENNKKKVKMSNSKNTNVNLIIKHVVDNKGKSKNNNDNDNDKKKQKIKMNSTSQNTNTNSTQNTNTTMVDSIYAQHEVDINIIAKLNKLIMELKQNIKDKDRDYNDMDGKMHYLKLDLGNCQIEKTDLLKQVDFLKQEQKKNNTIIKNTEASTKKYIFYWKFIKIFILLLFIFNIYFDSFKYLLLLMSIAFALFLKL